VGGAPLGEGGTELTYRVAVRPSNLLGLVLVPLGIGVVSRTRFGRAFRRYAAMAEEDGPEAAPPAEARPGGRRGASRALERLEERGVEPSLARLLLGYVLRADDRALRRIRPYALADLWSRDRRQTLVACLRATRAGVLDLHWNILCPLCRGSKEQRRALRELTTGTVHCDTCLIDFSVDLDRAVEVVFRPSRDVREVADEDFCVAGPQITPHVAAQLLLDPGEERTVRPSLDEGRHRIRTLDAGAAAPLDVKEEDGAGRSALRYGEGSWSADPPTVLPDAVLEVRNGSEREILAVLERTAWTDEAATAAEVTALQEFRDLFSEQVLATGEFVSVGSMAVLFTDLKRSTALYRQMGDARAYGRVRKHFRVLRGAIEPERGTVVKTIGDAVMAVFRTRAAALRSVVRAHEGVRELSGNGDGKGPLVLKAGLSFGPCLTVTMNGRLDYFGTTVNVAARLADLSTGDDVVVPDVVLDDPEARSLIDGDPRVEAAPLTAEPAGLDDLDLSLWRISVDGAGKGGRVR